jgi:hypothetical protein
LITMWIFAVAAWVSLAGDIFFKLE